MPATELVYDRPRGAERHERASAVACCPANVVVRRSSDTTIREFAVLNWIPLGRTTLAIVSLGCVSIACSGGETSPRAVATVEPAPDTAALDVSCDLQGVSPPASCEPQGTSRADINEPFETSASTSGRVVRFHVPGMTCEGCAWQIRETLLGIRGVSRAHTRLGVREAFVDYDPAVVDVATIAAALEAAAYPAAELEQGTEPNHAESGGG